MAFALFYERQDLSEIAAELQRDTMPNADKQIADRIMRGGMNGWDTAPAADAQYQSTPESTAIRIVVVDDNQVAKQDMIDLLLRCCENEPELAQYMCAIADDMRSTCIEPWPVA